MVVGVGELGVEYVGVEREVGCAATCSANNADVDIQRSVLGDGSGTLAAAQHDCCELRDSKAWCLEGLPDNGFDAGCCGEADSGREGRQR